MARKRGTRPKSDSSSAAATAEPHSSIAKGITSGDLVDAYKKMVLVRTVDERIWALNRQGKVPIAASCQGHEAAQIGSLLAAQKDGNCFLFPYYRDLGIKLAAGLTATQVMLSFMGKEGEPYSNGRQFPLQGADLKHNIIQISNVVGAGLTQAVGYALGCKMEQDGTVVLTYFGDGATSQGETHEAMNFAGVHQLPVVFICENNHYAISVPQSRQIRVPRFCYRWLRPTPVLRSHPRSHRPSSAAGTGTAGNEAGADDAPYHGRRRPPLPFCRGTGVGAPARPGRRLRQLFDRAGNALSGPDRPDQG